MPNVGIRIMSDNETIAAGTWGIDWTDQLATGETIASVVCTVRENEPDTGTDVTATVCPAGAIKDATSKFTTCRILGSGMDAAGLYYVHHKVTTTSGSVLNDYFEVDCGTS